MCMYVHTLRGRGLRAGTLQLAGAVVGGVAELAPASGVIASNLFYVILHCTSYIMLWHLTSIMLHYVIQIILYYSL